MSNKTISIPEEKFDKVMKLLLFGKESPLEEQEKFNLYDEVFSPKPKILIMTTPKPHKHYKKHNIIKPAKKEEPKHQLTDLELRLIEVKKLMDKDKEITFNRAWQIASKGQNSTQYYKERFEKYCKEIGE